MTAYRIDGKTYIADGRRAAPLYSREEWRTFSAADMEFDPAGRITFQGRLTAFQAKRVPLPKWAREGK